MPNNLLIKTVLKEVRSADNIYIIFPEFRDENKSLVQNILKAIASECRSLRHVTLISLDSDTEKLKQEYAMKVKEIHSLPSDDDIKDLLIDIVDSRLNDIENAWRKVDKQTKKSDSDLSNLWLTPLSLPVGYVFSGIEGVLGRTAISFFNSGIASQAGTFATFGSVGLISCPLTFVSSTLADYLIDHSEFLATRPNLKSVVQTSINFLTDILTIEIAAVALGMPPFGATVISLLVIPAAISSFRLLSSGIRLLTENCLANEQTLNDRDMELDQIPNDNGSDLNLV